MSPSQNHSNLGNKMAGKVKKNIKILKVGRKASNKHKMVCEDKEWLKGDLGIQLLDQEIFF